MQTFHLNADDGEILHAARWLPDGAPRAVVLISHGMSEYAVRYHRFAQTLTGAGYAVYAHDHRGHGAAPRLRGHFAADGGWDKVVADVDTLRRHAAESHPGLPVTLFGHSMGSFIARSYFLRHGAALSGLVPVRHRLPPAAAGLAAARPGAAGGPLRQPGASQPAAGAADFRQLQPGLPTRPHRHGLAEPRPGGSGQIPGTRYAASTPAPACG